MRICRGRWRSGWGRGSWGRWWRWGGRGGTKLHPLLHRNTSDLMEQRYSAEFSGEEFFLADHEVKGEWGGREKVLPGVAYLEMARAAVGMASGGKGEGGVLEWRHVVWAQPRVVGGKRAGEEKGRGRKEVSIGLWGGGGGG